MNLLAYRTTSLALKILTSFSRARISLHDHENLPTGGTIFAVNHFTRFETLLLPYHLSKLLDKPIWSLASEEFFSGLMGRYLEQVGAVSVADPERDNLIIKSLVGDSAGWIIFPEGRMVKNRKVFDHGNLIITGASGRHIPHTGAAALALRAEILRQRYLALQLSNSPESESLLAAFALPRDAELTESISIVPVNISYYPLRSADNLLKRFASIFEEKLSSRLIEEVLVEGSMLLDGVDIDIRFGKTINLAAEVERISGQRLPDFRDSRRSRAALRSITNLLMMSIYSRTTVNLDHILALLLYKNVGSRFSETALRYRAFLIATSARLEPLYFRHRGLKSSQVDLLLEKEGGRIAEVLDFAREKGLLSGTDPGKLIFNDPQRVCDGHAFHRIRVDNPFRVMVNTVEPLRPLQRLAAQLNRLPVWYLKRLVAGRLFKIMQSDYIDARTALSGAGELLPAACGRPYLVKKIWPKAGVVLIHDWLQTPSSLHHLAEYLGQHGFLVIVPRLPGHATIGADLENREFGEWQVAVDEAYAYAEIVCSKVVVCGVGNSVALALSLAARGYSGIVALVALFPALVAVSQTSSEPESGNEDHKTGSFYQGAPASSKRQVKKMLVQAVKNLPSVTTPLLLLNSEAISKNEQQSLQKYFAKVASSEKELLLYPAASLATLIRKDNPGGRALVGFIQRNI